MPGLDLDDAPQKKRDFVLAKGLTLTGELAKSVGLDMVDANLIGVTLPHGLFELTDPIIQRTAARIERELHTVQSGVHRHLEDVYYGGGGVGAAGTVAGVVLSRNG